MKVFVSGACRPENIYSMVDASAFSEAEFEQHVRLALGCVYPEYHCILFRGAYEFDGEMHESDLALIHRSLSHWFVIEVELVSHSLHGHVVPQVRCFRYGKPQDSCVSSLCSQIPNLTTGQARSLLNLVPCSTVVIANRNEMEWSSVLRGIDTQFMTVSVFSGRDGVLAYETEGLLDVSRTSLGFFLYSATNRTICMSESCGLPEGQLQIEDPYGNVGLWMARRAEGHLWVTKQTGDPGIPDKAMLQVLRTQTGRIRMRAPGY
jgi:hypothetical protein